ncbi:unnamed protein product [Thelazia callipaeda]|uniref:Ig-like domain-containing protein n=1 Tax=Thelazia callipaeda TaxID=103827 RepID=A0A0N5CJT5_THECL|nr:unnamed protein product [Thelazia callipaeda]
MASIVNVCSVHVLNNPFVIHILYMSNKFDQILDSILVGPIVEGRHKFIFEADGPDPTKIPESEIVGVTVLLLKCRYMEQEFINIGWFVATEYSDPEFQEEPPATPVLEKLQRKVCTDDVRVTTFAIKWRKNEDTRFGEGELLNSVSSSEDIACGPPVISRNEGTNYKCDFESSRAGNNTGI